jgi:hypothetical protein
MHDQGSGEARRWALEEFGDVRLGDERRRSRLIAMAARVARSPGGRVSEVFRNAAERQGAYDFLESEHVHASALVDALTNACVDRCSALPFAFVPIDGTSIAVTDRARKKDFGSVGTFTKGARGLKVIDAIAVSPSGIPMGVCAMQWWARPSTPPRRRESRKVADKETQHWLDAIDHVASAFVAQAPASRAWFQIDREGDAWPILLHLEDSKQLFTVRSRSSRRLRTTHGPRRYLNDVWKRARQAGDYLLEIPAGPHRADRLGCMHVRVATVTLDMRNKHTKARHQLTLNVVFAREVGTTPRGEKPLEWTLLTNRPVESFEDAQLVIYGYTQRWRIEDFHKAWKSGVCDVESTQLHGRAQVMKWATLLAGVAVRVERLKQLARQQPDLPATAELSVTEIEALLFLKNEQKKRNEVLPKRTPTIAEATLWIAEIGGYTGKSSGGPPGSITIGRGLKRLLIAAQVFEGLKSSGRMR